MTHSSRRMGIDMSADINFKRRVEGEGKSGYFTLSGVVISAEAESQVSYGKKEGEIIKIQGINRKGNLSPCKIEIPFENAIEVAEAILSLSKSTK